MWGLMLVVSAFAAAIVVMSFASIGRVRNTAKSIYSERPVDDRGTEFSERDRRTRISE
jgi:hypothetical protein